MSRHFETKTITYCQYDSNVDQSEPHVIFKEVLTRIIDQLHVNKSRAFPVTSKHIEMHDSYM